MAYRHFEHKDTDTNMFVERYVASKYFCLLKLISSMREKEKN